jgi:hypothetical protein
MVSAMEELRMVKGYRTPQGLRSFITVATFCLPPFYGPTFAAIGHEMNSIAMGLAFAIIASLALSCLQECVRALADPFVGHVTLDGIDVCEELNYLHYENLINTREVAFPDAPDFHADTLDDYTQSVRKAERVAYLAVIAETTKKNAGLQRSSLGPVPKVLDRHSHCFRSRFCRNGSVATLVSQSTTFPRSLLSAQDIATEAVDQAVKKVSRNELLLEGS